MPYFIFRGIDGPNGASIRADVRDAHRAYIRAPAFGCNVVAGGPLLDDQGEVMFGTLLVIEAPDRIAVECFMRGDPYAEAQLFAHIEIDRWHWGLGQPT